MSIEKTIVEGLAPAKAHPKFKTTGHAVIGGTYGSYVELSDGAGSLLDWGMSDAWIMKNRAPGIKPNPENATGSDKEQKMANWAKFFAGAEVFIDGRDKGDIWKIGGAFYALSGTHADSATPRVELYRSEGGRMQTLTTEMARVRLVD